MQLMKNMAVIILPALLASCGSTSRETEAVDEDHLTAIVLDSGEGEPIAFPGHPTSLLAAADTNKAGLSFYEINISAGKPGAPPHTHTHEDEFFYVREGTVTFLTGEDRKTLSAGGFVLLPRNGLHAVWNASNSDTILLVGTSQGQFDGFFDAVAMETQAKNLTSPQEIGETIGRIGAERGIVIDMEKIPEDVKAIYGI